MNRRIFDSSLCAPADAGVWAACKPILGQIEEDDAEMDMVPEPNLDKHVFCRVREDRRDVMFDPNDPDNTMDLDQGDIIMVRYRFIKGLLEDGALDLI